MPALKRADATAGRLEAGQVRAMFDRVAVVYDLLNTVMTAGLHHRWRARAVDLARVGPGSRVLDVATGTGDLAIELARRVSPGGEVVGSDFSENMLARARAKGAKALRNMPADPSSGARNGSGRSGPASLSFEWADALELPYREDSFDAATVGFGARNFSDLGRGLREMARVVRPGGRVVVLEMTTPTRPPLSLFYRLWFDRIVPIIGKLAGSLAGSVSRGNASSTETTIAQAYAYLPNSVRRFHAPAALAAEMERAGLSEIGYVLMAGGIIAVHGATVPRGGTP
ncbi:MAG TPA: ubiquinone/menaquinone biosynthesis methyltransferase [Solirubrobacteraceae bacterium]|nr:ubiquinone/menaquinone biosynthesis methyltransferase [Solirubrobacteraceae bacterium]